MGDSKTAQRDLYLFYRQNSLLNSDTSAKYEILRTYFNLASGFRGLRIFQPQEFEIYLAEAIGDDIYLNDNIGKLYPDIVTTLDKYFGLTFLYKVYGEKTVLLGVF